MPSKGLVVFLDANVIISSIAFGGVPNEVVDALLHRRFGHVSCAEVIEEARRNLTGKLGLATPKVQTALGLIVSVSTMAKPSGKLHATPHAPDNLVLEAALAGGCDVLVTGDKRHLLPLNPYKGLVIESPSDFLKRLG